MQRFEETTLTLPDGYEAYARSWRPLELRGAVLYLHGIQSHCGWYERSAAALCDAGFAVWQPDRRGSGRNARDRGHAESARQILDDTFAARDELLRRTGLDRFHLVGVSWGGKQAVAAYAAGPQGVASLSLVTPGLFPLVGVSGAEKFRIGLAMVADPDKRFDIPLNDADLFTAEPRWNRFIAADPLTLRQATAAFYLASRRLDKTCARLCESAAVPVHLLLAGDERIIDNAATLRFVRDLNWPFCRITTYDHARHSLEFEPPPCTYVADLISFIEDVNNVDR